MSDPHVPLAVSASAPRSAVVVGAGVMGLSVALALARRGVATVLCEKTRAGAGSSGKSGAILRAFYPQPVLVRMTLFSRERYARLSVEAGIDVGFRRPGALFLAEPAAGPILAATVRTLHAAGAAARYLEGAALREIEPRLARADDVVGAYEPDAAFVDPAGTIAALAALARRAGVALREETPVLEVLRDGERVVGVRTPGGEVRADVVVLATNAWTAPLLARLGIALPVRAVRPEQAYLAPPPGFGPPGPIVADFALDVYFKDEPGRGVRVGRLGYEDDAEIDPDSYDEGVSGGFVAFARERVAKRFPPFARAVSWGGCGALYGVTPDAQAAVGPAPGAPGLFLAAGFSGHGFKLAPAIGVGVAEHLLDGAPRAYDAAFFAPDRFAAGRAHVPLTNRPILG
jgi:glycine/D-amino acid oxidase-like deaminating enzyme